MAWADPGPARMGPVWEQTGLSLARTSMVPVVAYTNPSWDQTGLAIWVAPKSLFQMACPTFNGLAIFSQNAFHADINKSHFIHRKFSSKDFH